jgi:hypothetical protein
MKTLILITLLLSLTISCKKNDKNDKILPGTVLKGMVVEKAIKPSTFIFSTTPDNNNYFHIENIGDISIKGSVPDKTTVIITKKAAAKSKTRAAELMDKITYNPTSAKDGKIKISPIYPSIKGKEFVRTDLRVLVPLDNKFPFNIASTGGIIGIKGVRGIVNLKVSGKGNIEIRAFTGTITASIKSGKIHMGNKINGGTISMGNGVIFLSQREKTPSKPINLTVENGEIRIQLIKGIKVRLNIVAPKIENHSNSFKLVNGKYGSQGSIINVVVKKGKAVIETELY